MSDMGGHIKNQWRGGCVDTPRGTICIAAIAVAIASVSAHDDAHAQSGQMPAWVKQVFSYYVDGQISESELLDTIGYLIEKGVIKAGCSCDVDRAALTIADMEERRATIHMWLAVLSSGASNMEDYAEVTEVDSEYVEGVVDENAETLKEIERAVAYAVESAEAAERAAELGRPAEAAEEAEWVEYYADYTEFSSDAFADFASDLGEDIERMTWEIGMQKRSLERMVENMELLKPYEADYGVEFVGDFSEQIKRVDDAIKRIEIAIKRIEMSAEQAGKQAERAERAERAVERAAEQAERAVERALAEYR